MEPGKVPKQPLQGSSAASAGHPLTPQEQLPILILHVDVENSMLATSRYAKDAVSAGRGNLLDTSARRLVSHVLAEAIWGTINAETGNWSPVREAPQKMQLELCCCLTCAGSGDLYFPASLPASPDVQKTFQVEAGLRPTTIDPCPNVPGTRRRCRSGRGCIDIWRVPAPPLQADCAACYRCKSLPVLLSSNGIPYCCSQLSDPDVKQRDA